MGEGPLSRFTRIKRPVARDEGLLVEELADETVVYDNRNNQAHCLSPLAAVVFAHCDGDTTVEQLAALATERLGEPIDEMGVIDALAQLHERDLLAVPPRDGLSRRQMIRKSAVAAAGVASVPLITSIAAPTAIAGGSATCGELLCCACCQEEPLNKEECCTSPFVVTINCQCTGTRDNDTPVVLTGKYCKPAGVAAPDDDYCDALYTNAAGRQAHCLPLQTFPPSTQFPEGGGGANCSTCVVPAS